MSWPEINWEDTDIFVAGTTGPQGRRVFYLQARRINDLISLKLEKQQVAGLAEFFDRMLEDLPPSDIEDEDLLSVDDAFIEPGEPAWVIGSLGVTYQQSNDRIVLFADDIPAQARFPLNRQQVAAFITQARNLIDAGRPPCPWCEAPLESANEGWCPCAN